MLRRHNITAISNTDSATTSERMTVSIRLILYF